MKGDYIEKIKSIVNNRENIYFLLLLLLLVFLSKGYHFSSNMIVVICVFYLIDKNLKEKIKRIDIKLYLPFVLVFVIHLIGILYSDNTQKAISGVIARLSFILLPPIILSELISKKKLYKLLLLLKYYLLFFAIFLIIIQTFFIQYSLWKLTYKALRSVTGIHHMYFSQFYILVLLFVLHQLNERKIRIGLAIFEIAMTLFFIWILGAAPSMFFSLLFVLIATFIHNKSWFYRFLIFILLIGSIFSMRNTIIFENKINKVTQIEFNINKNIKKYQQDLSAFGTSNTLEMRLVKWHVALKIFRTNFWTGVGSGDYQDSLNKGYVKIKFANAIKYKYNTHNQYLEEGLKFGIWGVLLLLYFFANPLFLAYKERNWMLFAIVVYIVSIAVIESLFVRLHGVVFFSVVIPLLYVYGKKKD